MVQGNSFFYLDIADDAHDVIKSWHHQTHTLRDLLLAILW